jgi:hypothetical protein
MKIFKLSIILTMCVGLNVFSQDLVRQQLDRLDTHLTLIEEEARLERNLSGGILIGTGLLVGAGGVAITESVPGLSSDERIIYDAIFAGSGAAAITGGVLVLCLPTDFETLPPKWRELPEDTPENIRKKINIGEVYLEKLAHRAESNRYIGGGVLIVTGLAELAFYLFVPPEGNANLTYVHDMFLYQGILNCGIGILRLSIKSSPENEYGTYKAWKKFQGITQKKDTTEIQLAILPTARGLTAAVHISY